MPSCQKVSTFHSKEQRLYSQQAQAMLAKTPEYKQFQRVEDQTENLRMSWILGLMFFVIQVYADSVVFFTQQGDGKGLLGGFLRLQTFPPILTSLLSVGFLMYPVGWMLLAPWFGVQGPVEYTAIKTVVFAHLCSAVLFALAMDIKVGTFLEEWRLPTMADSPPVSLRALLPAFIGGLVPIATGLFMRWWLCSGSWKNRKVTTAPHFWLPPLHFIITMPLMIAVTYALRHLMTEKHSISPADLLSAEGFHAVSTEVGSMLTTMAKKSNMRTWSSKTGSLNLNTYLSFSASYVLFLFTTQIEIYMFSPLLRRIMLPQSYRLAAIYICGLTILAARLWTEKHEDRPLAFYMVVGYMPVLLIKCFRERDNFERGTSSGGDGGRSVSVSQDPEDDPK